jgi:hypothetical protein
MKGTDKIFTDSSIASKIPVISHLTYNEVHVFLIGVFVGVGSAHFLSGGYPFFVLLINAFVLLVLLGVVAVSQTRTVVLLRQESWYYLGGVVGAYAAYMMVIA